MEDKDQKPKLPVHLILGAGDYMRIKTNEKPRVGKIGEPVAERTKFGWTILAQGKKLDYSAMFLTQTSQCDYEEQCRMDVLGLADNPEHDQHEVYAEFREQLTRSEEGWYETGLPWKGNHPQLPNNYNGSLRRLANLQRKLQQNGLTDSYSKIIDTQKAEGIVEVASQDPQEVEFYIPHQPVIRESAESTKVRIVYDASAKANSGAPSLKFLSFPAATSPGQNQCVNDAIVHELCSELDSRSYTTEVQVWKIYGPYLHIFKDMQTSSRKYTAPQCYRLLGILFQQAIPVYLQGCKYHFGRIETLPNIHHLSFYLYQSFDNAKMVLYGSLA
jgi:hypothetical protein